jgi:acetoin utilization protein AcuB
MQAHKISSLPVVENGRVVGLLTTTDVLRAFVDLSGAAEPTTRIIVTGGSGRGAEDRVRRIVHGCRGELKWIHRHGRQLHLRLKSHRIDDVIPALEAAGFNVTAVVESRSGKPAAPSKPQPSVAGRSQRPSDRRR